MSSSSCSREADQAARIVFGWAHDAIVIHRSDDRPGGSADGMKS